MIASKSQSDRPSLFDTVSVWRDEPTVAFEGYIKTEEFFLSGQRNRPPKGRTTVRDNSAHVYGVMFKRFLQSLEEQSQSADERIAFTSVGPEHFEYFVSTALRDATRETTWRYLRLLERVYAHLVTRDIVQANPVTDWVMSRMDKGESVKVGKKSAERQFVDREELVALQKWLHKRGIEMMGGDEMKNTIYWREARDITLASLSLGTGMRCTELQKLSYKQVRFDRSEPDENKFEFDIPSSATVATAVRHHKTAADVASLELMTHWWAFRWSKFPGLVPGEPIKETAIVFPSTPKAVSALDASSLGRRMKLLADQAIEAGVLDDSTKWVLCSGARGMRRAYALTALSTGSPVALLAYRMGVYEQRSVRRYRDQLVAAGITPTDLKSSD